MVQWDDFLNRYKTTITVNIVFTPITFSGTIIKLRRYNGRNFYVMLRNLTEFYTNHEYCEIYR